MTKNKKIQEKGGEFIRTLIEKSWSDSEFKNALIEQPIVVIEQLIGQKFKVPNDKRIIIEDQTNSSIVYLNIPNRPNYDEIELTDEQLELVAGGEFVVAGVSAWWLVGAGAAFLIGVAIA